MRELTAAAAVANGDTLWLAQLGEAHALAGDHARARGIEINTIFLPSSIGACIAASGVSIRTFVVGRSRHTS